MAGLRADVVRGATDAPDGLALDRDLYDWGRPAGSMV